MIEVPDPVSFLIEHTDGEFPISSAPAGYKVELTRWEKSINAKYARAVDS
jgi:hypothetical protein